MTKYMNLPEPRSVLLLGARYGTGNLGVDALLSGSIHSLLRCNPGAEIAVLDFGREEGVFRVPHDGSEVEVRLINLRFSWKLWLRNNGFRMLILALLLRAIPVPSLRRWSLARNPELAEIEEASVALSLAGGDSFSDIYGFRRLLYVSLPQLLVLAMGRPLVLLPQTLGPFKAGWARWIGRFILRRRSGSIPGMRRAWNLPATCLVPIPSTCIFPTTWGLRCKRYLRP
jgi:colanic acid/amylovoran biosynthesis protein